MTAVVPNYSAEDAAQQLRTRVAAIRSGDFDETAAILADSLWDVLEASYWNAEHPLPSGALQALDAYVSIGKSLWHKSGLGQGHPIALYRTTLLSSKAINIAMRVLARIYAGCNLGYRSPPPGFWRTVYALTGYVVSDKFTDRANRELLTNQSLQLWLMAWLNPLSLAPGRLPVAVRLVGILSKTCSYTLASPTHAGSGLAAADLMGDSPPMPFARVPAMWEPIAPLYINAQDAAFTIRELTSASQRAAPNDVYESLLQSALQVGLSQQEMQDFVRRAMREFGYSNSRSIPRVGRADSVTVVIGFIDVWNAVQSQSKAGPKGKLTAPTHAAVVVNHSDGGFLLRIAVTEPLLSVGSLLCLRGSEAEPWSIIAVRWLEETDGTVMIGTEVLCNFGEARIAQHPESAQHLPILTYQKDEATWVIAPYDSAWADSVSQLQVEHESWVLAVATELGSDWQRSPLLDSTAIRDATATPR